MSDARSLAPPTAITAGQMVELDRVMLDDLGIAPLQLMEIAGHAVATFARDRMLNGDASGRRVIALAGNGGNGGDALVAARLLTAWGAMVTIVIARPAEAHTGLAAHHLAIARRWGIPVRVADERTTLEPADLLLDGLLGFSLQGDPHGVTASLIEAGNAHGAPILAIDLPSGLNATTGVVGTPCILAHTTLTLALTKTGLLTPRARDVVGELWVADIGISLTAYGRVGQSFAAAPFASGPFQRVFGKDKT